MDTGLIRHFAPRNDERATASYGFEVERCNLSARRACTDNPHDARPRARLAQRSQRHRWAQTRWVGLRIMNKSWRARFCRRRRVRFAAEEQKNQTRGKQFVARELPNSTADDPRNPYSYYTRLNHIGRFYHSLNIARNARTATLLVNINFKMLI